MPMRVPSIDGAPISAVAFGQNPAPTPDRSAAIGAQQLQQAGQQLQQAGGAVMAFGDQFADQANDARSRQQATLHAVDLDDIVRGYEERLGEDAYDGRKSVLESVEKLRGKHAGKLENGTQGELYRRMVDAQVERVRGRIETHYSRQTRAWNISQTEASLTLHARDYGDAALLGDKDDKERSARMQVARGVMEKEFDKLAQLSGLTGDAAKALKSRKLAELHASTLDNLANTNAEQARDYFETFRGELDPKTAANASKVIEAAELQDRALKTARDLMASAGDDATPTERLMSVMDGASKITDANEFNAVMSFAGAEYQRQLRVEAGSKNDLINEVDKLVSSEGGEFLTFEQLPPTLQTALRTQGLTDEAMGLIGSRDRTTNERVFNQILFTPNMLQGIPPELFERTYRKELSRRDYAAVRGMWAQVNNQAPAQAQQPRPVASVLDISDIMTSLLRDEGYTPDVLKDDPIKAAEAMRLRETLQRAIDAGRITNDMPYDAQKAAVEQLVFKERADQGPLNAGIAGATVQVPLPTGEIKTSVVGAVPDIKGQGEEMGVRTFIIRQLQLEGTPDPTEVEIQQMWFMLGTPEFASVAAKRMTDQNRSFENMRKTAEHASLTEGLKLTGGTFEEAQRSIDMINSARSGRGKPPLTPQQRAALLQDLFKSQGNK